MFPFSFSEHQKHLIPSPSSVREGQFNVKREWEVGDMLFFLNMMTPNLMREKYPGQASDKKSYFESDFPYTL